MATNARINTLRQFSLCFLMFLPRLPIRFSSKRFSGLWWQVFWLVPVQDAFPSGGLSGLCSMSCRKRDLQQRDCPGLSPGSLLSPRGANHRFIVTAKLRIYIGKQSMCCRLFLWPKVNSGLGRRFRHAALWGMGVPKNLDKYVPGAGLRLSEAPFRNFETPFLNAETPSLFGTGLTAGENQWITKTKEKW